jgi:DNA-binding NarL/FixJ family response regulator
MSIKIVLVDDHQILRSGLRAALEKYQNMKVIGEASDGRSAVKLLQKIKPDVVIMDVTMPGLNGIEATRQVIAQSPNTKVIALSMHSDENFVAGMFEAGASGYLLKDCSLDEMETAIRSVTSNHVYLSPVISRMVINGYFDKSVSADHLGSSPLTPKEREVLQLLAEGKTTKEVASSLHMSVKTAETHRHHIMKKLNIHNIVDLTKYAIREGLTSLDS